MNTPEFREPGMEPVRQRSPRHNRRLTEAQAEKRYAYLDLIDRRCDAHSRKCITAANLIIRAIPLKNGEPAGDEVELKSCTRHRRIFVRNVDNYRILSEVDLPPGKPVTRQERNRLV